MLGDLEFSSEPRLVLNFKLILLKFSPYTYPCLYASKLQVLTEFTNKLMQNAS